MCSLRLRAVRLPAQRSAGRSAERRADEDRNAIPRCHISRRVDRAEERIRNGCERPGPRTESGASKTQTRRCKFAGRQEERRSDRQSDERYANKASIIMVPSAQWVREPRAQSGVSGEAAAARQPGAVKQWRMSPVGRIRAMTGRLMTPIALLANLRWRTEIAAQAG